MKPEHRRYILVYRDAKSVTELARDLGLKERTVRRFLEQECREKKAAFPEPPVPAPAGRKKLLLSVLLIVCVGAAVYANAPRGAFLWDDSHLVEENRFVRSWKHIPQIFSQDIGAGADNNYHAYRPLQTLTYLLEYPFTKTDPAGYHIGNILWHVFSALALFWLLQVLFKDHLLALVTSILFVAHPVHTEAVTYISGRTDPLSTAFILLTFVFYFKSLAPSTRTPPMGGGPCSGCRPKGVKKGTSGMPEGLHTRRVPLFLLAFLSYACALLSRENAVIVPVLLLLTHYALRKKISWPYFLGMTGLAAGYVVLRFTVLSSLLNLDAHSTTVFDRLPGFLAALVLYIRILLFPFHLHMEYGGWPYGWGHVFVLVGLAVLGGLLYIIFKEKGRRSLVFFALAWFLIALVPVSNLYPLNAFMAEHWLYLPSIGFFLLVAYALVVWLRRAETKVPALIGLVVLTGFWGVLTFRQNITWLEPISFFHRLLRYAPYSSRAYNSLGMAYNNIGDFKTGVSYLERAVELSSMAAQGDAVKAYNNLALVYNKLGRSEEAARIAEGALSMDSTHAKAYNNLAISLVRLGKYEEAIEACRKALAQKPDYAKAYNTMAAAYMNMERYDEAIANYKKAMENAPEYPEAQNNLGLLLQRMGRPEEAIVWHRKAIALRPDYANAYNNLAAAYKALGRTGEAVAAYTQAAKLDPKRPDIYLNLAALALEAGDRPKAVAYYGSVKELGASNPEFEKMLEPYR